MFIVQFEQVNPGGLHIYEIYPFMYLFCTIQEECLKHLDNKPSYQPKIKRKNVNPYGEIVVKGFLKISKCRNKKD